MKDRGFVTLATGSEKYYHMALVLRISAKLSNPDIPFAIITDKGNPYVDQFDDVVFLDNPRNNWLDKVDVLINAPYEHNLFIESDCIVYGNLEETFTLMQEYKFAVFGEKLPVAKETQGGWFTLDGAGEYKDKIHYIPRMHGGMFHVRPSEFCKRLHERMLEVDSKYEEFTFITFNDKKADEPIFAMACAIENADILPFEKMPMITLPIYEPITKKFKIQVKKRKPQKLRVIKKDGTEENAGILHFGSYNVWRNVYQSHTRKMLALNKGRLHWLYYAAYCTKAGLIEAYHAVNRKLRLGRLFKRK